MSYIFISYCGKDRDFVNSVIGSLNSVAANHTLWFYGQSGKERLEMEEVIRKLAKADLFVVFLSGYSLRSANVQREMAEAIRLSKAGRLKRICPILPDRDINVELDGRIPQDIKSYCIHPVESPAEAAEIIRQSILGNEP